MDIPLIRKLEQFTRLSGNDKRALEDLTVDRIRKIGPRDNIIHEGDKPDAVYLILSGWGCRYKTLEDGRRQVMAFLLPGDLCDLNIFVLREMDHSICALTAVNYAEIDGEALAALALSHPRVTRALWWEALVSLAIQREWSVNLGQRTATERIAHLLCELFFRLRAVGLTTDLTCDLPVTQAELADASGLSAVHVNRTIQELRAADLIVLRGRTLTILDLEALKTVALFNPNYLHLNREGGGFDANEP
jgi:CRP-like cAMP-binding protein